MAALDLQAPKTHLRISGLLEGISFLLLLGVAMPLKYGADRPEFVAYTGMAHGVLFVWYILSVIWARAEKKLTNSQTLLSMAASVFPFGTFYVENKIFKHL